MFTDEHQQIADKYIIDYKESSDAIKAVTTEYLDKYAKLTELVGNLGYVYYPIVDGKIDKGNLIAEESVSKEKKELKHGDVIYIVNEDGSYEKVEYDTAISIEGKICIIKFIPAVTGMLAAYEDIVKASERAIESYLEKMNYYLRKEGHAEVNADELKVIYNSNDLSAVKGEEFDLSAVSELFKQDNVLEYTVSIGNEEKSISDVEVKIKAAMIEAIGYIHDIDALNKDTESATLAQEEIEEAFAEAMGSMLRDGYWSDSNYTVGQEESLYNDAVEISKKLAYPTVSYTIETHDLSFLDKYAGEEFKLAQTVRIYDPNMNLNDYGIVSEVAIYPDKPTSNSIAIKTDLLDIGTKSFATILERVTSLAEQVRRNKDKYERAAAISKDGTIKSDILEGAIDVMKTQLLSNASNWRTDEKGNIIFVTLDGKCAMMLCGSGFMIANSKLENGDWNWRTFGTGNGFAADLITTGYLSAARIDTDELLAKEGFIDKITTNIIESSDLGSRIDMANQKIDMLVTSGDSETHFVLSDFMVSLITSEVQIAVDKVDLSANESIQATIRDEVADKVTSLEMTADKFETFVENSEGISQIKQTADKIDILVSSESNETNVVLTDKAIEAISKNIDVHANEEFNLTIGEMDSSIKANKNAIEANAEAIKLTAQQIELKAAQTEIDRLTGLINQTSSRIEMQGDSITFIVGEIEKLQPGSRIFRQETFPTSTDGVKPNDILVVPSTGKQYQAIELAADVQFFLGSDGALYYTIDDYNGKYSVEMQKFDLYSTNFTLNIGEDGTIGESYVWELVRDIELQKEISDRIDTAQTTASAAQNSANNAQTAADKAQVSANNAQVSVNDLNRLTNIEVIEGTFAQTERREGEGIRIFSEIKPKQDLTYGDPYPGGAGKNLCPPIIKSAHINGGITWTPQYDTNGALLGYKTSGTSTSSSTICHIDMFDLPAGTYVISGAPSGSVHGNGDIVVQDESMVSIARSFDGSTVNTFTLSAAGKVRVLCQLSSGTVSDGKVFKPQLEKGSTPTEYQPWENICPIEGYTGLNAVACGKNLLPTPDGIKTSNGLTSVSTDGKISVSGTVTSSWAFITNYAGVRLIPGNIYRVSLKDAVKYRVVLRFSKEATDQDYVDAIDISAGNRTAAFYAKDNYNYCSMWIGNLTSGNEISISNMEVQIEAGSNLTEFAPYQGTDYMLDFGKNLINPTYEGGTSYGVTITEAENGYCNLNGTCSTSSVRVISILTLEPGTYMFSFDELSGYTSGEGTTMAVGQVWDNANNAAIVAVRWTARVAEFTLSETKEIYIRLYMQSGTTYEDWKVAFQLECGDKASTYAPYNPDMLEQTGGMVYGATVDWHAGEMVVDRGMYDISKLSWFYNTSSVAWVATFVGVVPNAYVVVDNSVKADWVCSSYKIVARNYLAQGCMAINALGNMMAINGSTTVPPTGMLCYKLAEPIHIPLTPAIIKSLNGINTVCTDADEGRVEFGHEVVDVIDNVMPPASPKMGALWLDRSLTPAVLRRWSGTEWGVVNDVSLIEAVQDSILTRQAALEAEQRKTALYLKLDDTMKAVRIGQAGITSEFRIDAFGSGVVVNDEIFSRFEANRVIFGNMEIRKPATVGGLAFDAIK